MVISFELLHLDGEGRYTFFGYILGEFCLCTTTTLDFKSNHQDVFKVQTFSCKFRGLTKVLFSSFSHCYAYIQSFLLLNL